MTIFYKNIIKWYKIENKFLFLTESIDYVYRFPKGILNCCYCSHPPGAHNNELLLLK